MIDKKKYLTERLSELSSRICDFDFNSHNILIWGAGNTSNLCQRAFSQYDIHPFCYIDKNRGKQGSVFHGHNVMPPDILNDIDNPVILISSANIEFINEIKTYLNQRNLKNFTIDEYFFGKNSERLINAMNMLSDEKSINLFCDIILNRIENKSLCNNMISDEQYFVLPNFKKISSGDVFVNLGAYRGEEIEKYLEYCNGEDFGKIISFEPDRENYAEMMKTCDRLNYRWRLEEGKIQCVMAAVSDATKTSSLTGQGVSAMMGEIVIGDCTSTDVFSLDDFMPNGKIDFLKADIEGHELDMLHGAKQLIVNNVPKIAICIYHSPNDFFEIIEHLSNLDLGYKFSIRHHSETFLETILYAYID